MNVNGKRRRTSRRSYLQRKALALTIGGSIALAFAGGALAQAVNGTIQGTVPVAPDTAVQITNDSGFNRTITVGPSGRYSIEVPVGTYSVHLLQNGKVVQTLNGVTAVGQGSAAADFSATSSNVQTLSTVNVTAMAIPPIDVTSTSQITTITARQLQQLPLARSAENIALLSPGVTQAAALLQANNPTPLGTATLSFGGASDAENACYLDGMNTTDELTGQGCYTLPYNSIEQQQTYTSGYGAKYGRSIGGVISQVGKSGSNQWHFGVRGLWQPASLQADFVNQFWGNPNSTTAGQELGNLREYRKDNRGMETIYDAYVSGPIIPDKLTFFLSGEEDNLNTTTTGPTSNPFRFFTNIHRPKIYAKINWNINENNILTLSGLQSQNKTWESQYNFDYNTLKTGDFSALLPNTKNSVRMWVANYTSFLTNDLTLHAMYGKMHNEFWTGIPPFPGFNPNLPAVFSASTQNPAFLPPGSHGLVNSNTTINITNPGHRSTVANYRVSLDWKVPWNLLGTHDISFGIDNVTTWDKGDGAVMSGPGYAWQYGQNDPNTPIAGTNPNVAPYAGPPSANGAAGAKGYYVAQYVFENAASVRVAQRAEYVEDRWQIVPDFLLTLGIRNGTFTNYNPAGVAYVKETKPNWQPRIGFSWNVLGDSTLKVFGNAGRYYIAMPAAVALRGAGASTFTRVYGTYTGINPDGTPIGFTPLPMNNGGHGNVDQVGVSANNEYGEALNPLLVAATNARPEYSDNFVLGGQWQFLPAYVAGATATYQKLGRILDDWDDQQAMCAAGVSEGFSYMTPDTCTEWTQGSVLINPGGNEGILVTSPSGALNKITVSSAQQGWQKGPKRNYYSLDLNIEHPWNGKWFARADVVFSRSYGNTEGPVDSNIGQGGDSVVITEQWDFAQLMEFSNGILPNDQKWQFKLYGAYAINPEWTVGGNLFVGSGHPKACLGYYGPGQSDPLGYAQGFGGAYHWCFGSPAIPGTTGFTPWTHELDLNVNYSPAFAEHRLNFNLAVFNAFNEQKPLQYYYGPGTSTTPFTLWKTPLYWEQPRSIRFEASYDF